MSHVPESACVAKWPFSLPRDVCDPLVYDLASYSERFQRQSNRIFCSPDETRIKVISLKSENHTFSNAFTFQTFLEQDQMVSDEVRLILIPQFYSWGKLMISEQAMELILNKLKAFPLVFDVIEAFGERTGPTNESLGGIQVIRRNQVETELCFLLKHVEEHGRDEPGDKWSIRQMGVYSCVDNRGPATFVVINPSQTFQQRLKEAKKGCRRPLGSSDVFRLLISCSSTRWRSHINDLEEAFTHLKSKANDAAVASIGNSNGILTIDFGDSQDLRVIADKLLRLDHILETNSRVYRDMVKTIQCQDPNVSLDEKSENHGNIGSSLVETELQRSRVLSLLKRMGSSSELMQNIIAARGLYALQHNGQITTGIMRLAQSDNKMMLDFSRKAQNDARTLKTITILTMIYLPASFVSQVLAMGYIKVETRGSSVSLHFAGEMVVFAVLSISLLAMTLGTWAFLEWRRRVRSTRRLTLPSSGKLDAREQEAKDMIA
ncbi:uncharacterized protein PV09_02975 [Verruconis gallopava]|uniref:CorA-like transporter domain-containing protein n=1 Tax=Verruconis gallopava TaxID=253628 RepID=A0A0D2AJ46_9PEZI|nr:uncharacterized protein PV09_02975 [Verruconis gallopava]KIW06545.1 hypothetical protein PV09_02975 [Verruconis gallopava]